MLGTYANKHGQHSKHNQRGQHSLQNPSGLQDS